MEGFELINKYNERCLQWRSECCRLISEWAVTETGPNEASPLFTKQCSALVGFLCAKGNETRHLLEAVHNARIEHVALALRYLRDRLSPKKAACQFCTRFTETGEHVAACLGEAPDCNREWHGVLGTLKCTLPTGHLGHHRWTTSATTRTVASK